MATNRGAGRSRPGRLAPWTFRALALLGPLLTASPSSAQQAFRGRVIDDSTERGVSGAEVVLIQDGERLAASMADGEGRFLIPTLLTGDFRLEVRALGYETAQSQPVRLEFRDTLSVELRVLPDAILLSPLLVTSRSNQGRNQFSRRQQDWGRGIFLGPDAIEMMELRHAGDVFRDQEDVSLRWGWGRYQSGGSGPVPRIRTYRGTGCLKYMVDRNPVRPPPWLEGADPWTIYPLDGLQAEDIRAVEIYRYVGEAPPELRRHATWDDAALCGLVVFWTWAGW